MARSTRNLRWLPINFTRREPGPTEIVVDTLYCGVCHSDLHMVRNEWGQSVYPWFPATRLLAASRPPAAQ
jgi:uncharacterized zinc-type alcohol dehydrogenase-like protein